MWSYQCNPFLLLKGNDAIVLSCISTLDGDLGFGIFFSGPGIVWGNLRHLVFHLSGCKMDCTQGVLTQHPGPEEHQLDTLVRD